MAESNSSSEVLDQDERVYEIGQEFGLFAPENKITHRAGGVIKRATAIN